jgi:integrase
MRANSLDTQRVNVGKPRGKHPEKRLTAVTVRSLRTPGRFADGNGLYLVVDDSGAKRWILRTVIKGKRRDLGLGSTQLVTLAEARDEATRLRRMARAGQDPLASRRRERRPVPTFEEVAKIVHTSHSKTFRNERHKDQWLSSLESYIFPAFGSRPVDQVDSAEILKALSPIWTAKPETARRLKQRIKLILDWAKGSGHRAGDNPVDALARVLPRTSLKQAHHPALPYAELPEFISALRASDCTESTKLAFEFLILTAARTSEVLGARWSEISFEKKTWIVPASRIKAGREHRVPLSTRCVEILERAEVLSNGDFVFPGRSENCGLSNMTLLMALERLRRDDITAHGFRSSFRDWAAEKTNFAHAAVEAALAHVVRSKTEAAYFRTDLLDARRKLMEAWAIFATAPSGKLIRLRA